MFTGTLKASTSCAMAEAAPPAADANHSEAMTECLMLCLFGRSRAPANCEQTRERCGRTSVETIGRRLILA